jgi:hypothetical protein
MTFIFYGRMSKKRVNDWDSLKVSLSAIVFGFINIYICISMFCQKHPNDTETSILISIESVLG